MFNRVIWRSVTRAATSQLTSEERSNPFRRRPEERVGLSDVDERLVGLPAADALQRLTVGVCERGGGHSPPVVSSASSTYAGVDPSALAIAASRSATSSSLHSFLYCSGLYGWCG